MKDRAVLHAIEKEREVTEEENAGFLLRVREAALLALRESGRLSGQQYRRAEDLLKSRCRVSVGRGEACSHTDRGARST